MVRYDNIFILSNDIYKESVYLIERAVTATLNNIMTLTQGELKELDAEIQELIRKTGVFIKSEFERFSFQKVQYKAQNDPFSYVDITAENILKEGGEKLLPGSGFINEESENQPSQNGYSWIIDPLDGTVNFIHGLPHFSISVALAYEDHTYMGYVYGVVQQEMFHAIHSQGAFLNEQPLQVSIHEKLQQSLVVTGFPYSYSDWLDNYIKVIGKLIEKCHGLRRIGSAALDLAYVAAGRTDAFFEFGLNPWDVAAGALIVQEAGGMVTDFEGGKQFLHGKQILASNGNIHRDILGLLNQYLPDLSMLKEA